MSQINVLVKDGIGMSKWVKKSTSLRICRAWLQTKVSLDSNWRDMWQVLITQTSSTLELPFHYLDTLLFFHPPKTKEPKSFTACWEIIYETTFMDCLDHCRSTCDQWWLEFLDMVGYNDSDSFGNKLGTT